MANWKQIQGRIRRARTSADPLGKLTELFQKTRDPMVAYEVASFEEKAGRNNEAVHWYTTAATRFRRADWKQRAADALARLGAPAPEMAHSESQSEPGSHENFASHQAHTSAENVAAESTESEEESQAVERRSATEMHAPSSPAEHRKRRRGRRGGRRHRRKGPGEHTAPAGGAKHAAHGHPSIASPSREAFAAASPAESVELEIPSSAEIRETLSSEASAEPSRIFERATYIRAGDPALSSRFAHLESLLRRLISAPLHRLDEATEAPAGPGVLLLSDSDLMTSYYIQACQTLRIGAGQVSKPGRAGRGAREEKGGTLRSRLAEHLEISENQAGEYLKKHCTLRWLQLDEEAPHLAHFAIAILRPALNTE